MEGVSKPLFCLGRVAKTLHTAKGFGEISPSVPALMLCFYLKLSFVPSKPLVTMPLYVPPLSELCLPWNPQPWSLRQCDGNFELVASLPFECSYATQKV
jgi:hypothetical protein